MGRTEGKVEYMVGRRGGWEGHWCVRKEGGRSLLRPDDLRPTPPLPFSDPPLFRVKARSLRFLIYLLSFLLSDPLPLGSDFTRLSRVLVPYVAVDA